MDIKLKKQDIVLSEKIFSASAEVRCEGKIQEQTLPTPEKILKCSCRSAITSKAVSDKSVTVEGMTTISVIYLDGEENLCSGENTLLFSKSFEADTSLYGGEVSAELWDEKCTATLSVGGIQLSFTAVLGVEVTKNTESEVVCDAESRDIEKLCGKAEITMPISKAEKNMIVEEEVSVGNGQPSVERLIRNNATVTVEDTKIMGGKVMVKGTVRVYALYLPEGGGRPQSFEDSFPFGQLLDAEGVGDDCLCTGSAKLLYCQLEPDTTVDDEIRSFVFTAKISVCAEVYCESEIPVVIDAYSTKGGCRVERCDRVFRKLREKMKQRFVARKEIEFTEGAIASVTDMWCEMKNCSCRFEGEEMKVSGVVIANLLVTDTSGTPDCFERPVEFEYSYRPEKTLEAPKVDFAITVTHCSYTVMGENTISLAIEPQITASIYENKTVKLLSNIYEDETAAERPMSSSIVLYFADRGETLWDIARRYNSSIDEIKALNNVSEDVLVAPCKFIIPTK